MTTAILAKLERDAEHLHAEIERQLAEARDQLRELQDIDAEDPPFANAKRYLAHLRLGDVAQRFLLAQCELVSPADSRYWAAQRTAAQLRDTLLSGPLRARLRKRIRSRLRVRESMTLEAA